MDVDEGNMEEEEDMLGTVDLDGTEDEAESDEFEDDNDRMFIDNTPYVEDGMEQFQCMQDKANAEDHDEDAAETFVQAIQSVKRPRGRPRKNEAGSDNNRSKRGENMDADGDDDKFKKLTRTSSQCGSCSRSACRWTLASR